MFPSTQARAMAAERWCTPSFW